MMRSITRALVAALSMIVVAGILPASASDTAPEKSDNVRKIATFPYKNKEADFFSGGTDMDFQGRFVYAMQQGSKGGIHIFDRSGPKPRKVGFFPCPGSQNDIAVVRPGLVALAYHESTCGGPGAGIRLVDVRDPKNVKLRGAVNDLPEGTHTLTVYPGKPIIYASPGGLANGNGTEQIIDVSNPRKPKVAATFTPQEAGCHDVSFYITKEEKLAVCVGGGEGQVWDVTDPLAPVTIGQIPVSAQFPHSVDFTDDGKYMVIGDEAVAGNDCVGGPTGALWIYDFAVREAPVIIGSFGPPRGPLPVGSSNYDRNTWCSAHLFNFVPGTYTLVSSWYAGGMNVIDLSDPTMPTEIAYYMGTGDGLTNYWSAYWYKGRIYANDRVKGLDVFTVKGLKEIKPVGD